MTAPLDPTLALGLGTVIDYSSEYPFIDMQKFARPTGGNGGVTWPQLYDSGCIGADGWPTFYPPELGVTTTGGSFNTPLALPLGAHVLKWPGSTVMTLYGDKNPVTGPQGRYLFNRSDGSGNTNFGYNMTSYDTVTLARPKIYRLEHENLVDLGVEFNPIWLDIVGRCRQFRFKDWMCADSALQVEWSERMPDNYASYAAGGNNKPVTGVPVEVMVRLANLAGVDPWFCFPYKASDDYVTQFVTYVKANLNPLLKATFEYGNEAWNTAFASQRIWNNAQAEAAWGGTNILYYMEWNTYRATKMAQIVRSIYGGEYAARAKCVINVNTVNPQFSTSFVAPRWLAADPGGYVDPRTVIDSCAVTSYFGAGYCGNTARAQALRDRINSTGAAASYTWLANELITNAAISMSVPAITAAWQSCLDYLTPYGIDLVMYEGGQHIEMGAYSGLDAGETTAMTTFLQGFVKSAPIADVFQASWDAWKTKGKGPYMQYVDVLIQRAGTTGTSWGMLNDLTDSQPRATKLLALNESESPWFPGSGGGIQYVPKTIKALSAGQNADVGVRGGTVASTVPVSGKKRVNMPGPRSSFSFAYNAGTGAYTITGPSDFDLVTKDIDCFKWAA